jgi:hypothetical protein
MSAENTAPPHEARIRNHSASAQLTVASEYTQPTKARRNWAPVTVSELIINDSA